MIEQQKYCIYFNKRRSIYQRLEIDIALKWTPHRTIMEIQSYTHAFHARDGLKIDWFKRSGD